MKLTAKEKTNGVDKTDGVRWDLSSFFPEFNGQEMLSFKKKLEEDVARLQARVQEIGPMRRKNLKDWEELLISAEDFIARLSHIFSYVGCLKAAHTDKDEYAQEEARLSKLLAEFEKFNVDVLEAFKGSSDKL